LTIQRLKAKSDEATSNFASSFNLRRYAMELCPGSTLRDWIRLRPRLAVSCVQLGRAVQVDPIA
jgi:hypothetical protein